MQVSERDVGDLARLKLLTRREADAEQRDRLRAAQLAIEGVQTAEIQRRLDRSRGFVQRWVYAYRDGGIYPLLKRLGYSCLGFPLCPICHPCDRLNTLTTPPPSRCREERSAPLGGRSVHARASMQIRTIPSSPRRHRHTPWMVSRDDDQLPPGMKVRLAERTRIAWDDGFAAPTQTAVNPA